MTPVPPKPFNLFFAHPLSQASESSIQTRSNLLGLPHSDTVKFGSAPLPNISTLPIFPAPLQKRIEAAVTQVYGEAQTPEICQKITEIVQQVAQARPPELVKDDFERPSDWFTNEVIYPLYAERFGTHPDRPNTFKDLSSALNFPKDLGATMLWVLPFLESPMVDAGFDVSNYLQVRNDLGGNEEFDAFLAEARKRDLKVMADLVFNHISDQHPWFQAALQGDPEKLKYFLVNDSLPEYSVIQTEEQGKVIAYQEKDGTTSKRRLILSDNSKHHYREVMVGDKKKYIYHTFYPQQLDLNWSNPQVLYETLKILGHWGNKGIDLFRKDAISFLVKPPGTTGENSPETHALIQILSACLEMMSLRSASVGETPDSSYLGNEVNYERVIPGHGIKPITRTDKMQLVYDFPMMSAIWSAMVTQSPETFWGIMKDAPPTPDSAARITFLRLHDELTLEMVEPKTRKVIYDALVKKGESFREGLGVSGRMSNFLDHDPKRIALINSILFSLPGVPLVYYGDEIGAANDPVYMEQAAKERAQKCAQNGAEIKSSLDSRDLGRGYIAKEQFTHAINHPESREGQIYHTLKQLIHLRKQQGNLLAKGSLVKIPSNLKSTFSYLRKYKDDRMLVVNNLSGEETATLLKLPPHLPVASIPVGGLYDLQTDKPIPFKRNVKKNQLELKLEPYQSLWLKFNPSAEK